MNQYEGMFLFDPTFGSSDEQCEAEINRLMERASAELVLCRKWEERRLAYRVNGRKRGVYVLTYFKAAADKIGGIERDVKLSETVLRVLILRADGMTLEHMEAAFVRRDEESDRDDGGYSHGGRDRRPDRSSGRTEGPRTSPTRTAVAKPPANDGAKDA